MPTVFRCRSTGAIVEVDTADAVGCDPEGGRWVAICRDHGAVLNASTRARALSAGRYPDFCSDCAERL